MPLGALLNRTTYLNVLYVSVAISIKHNFSHAFILCSFYLYMYFGNFYLFKLFINIYLGNSIYLFYFLTILF